MFAGVLEQEEGAIAHLRNTVAEGTCPASFYILSATDAPAHRDRFTALVFQLIVSQHRINRLELTPLMFA